MRGVSAARRGRLVVCANPRRHHARHSRVIGRRPNDTPAPRRASRLRGFANGRRSTFRVLILAAAEASKGRPDGTLLDAARLTYKGTRERVLNLAVEDSNLHVGHHLRQAAEGIEATFANVERERRAGSFFDGTQALALLRGAYRHLESVSKLTPGFRLVDTSNSCCGFGP